MVDEIETEGIYILVAYCAKELKLSYQYGGAWFCYVPHISRLVPRLGASSLLVQYENGRYCLGKRKWSLLCRLGYLCIHVYINRGYCNYPFLRSLLTTSIILIPRA